MNTKKIQITLYHVIGSTSIREYDENLTHLDLSDNQITRIEGLDKLVNLQYLNLSDNQISELECLDGLVNLQTLFLSNNKISKIEGLDKLVNLQKLDLYNNKITIIEGLDKLINLQNLYLYNNKITIIEGLDKLINLQKLDLSNNKISKIEDLDKLVNLQYLDLYNNKISKIENLDKLVNLQNLFLSNNKIRKIEGLDQLINLQYLNLYYNQIDNYDIISDKFCYVDGIFSIIKSKRIKDDVIIIKTNKDKFIVSKDGIHSHGETLKEAYLDLEFKFKQKYFNLDELVESIKLTNIVSEDDYRLLTGACKEGIKQFKNELGLKENYLKLDQLIQLTKGKYGHEKIITLFN